MKLYAVAFVAETKSGYRAKAGSIKAENEIEAREKALKVCRYTVFPEDNGYSAHDVALCLIEFVLSENNK